MKKCAFFLIVILMSSSCMTLKNYSKIKLSDQEISNLITTNKDVSETKTPVDYKAEGDALMVRWEANLKSINSQLGTTKKKLTTYGAIVTGVGGIGSILIPNLSADGQKFTGIGVSIIGVIIGAMEIIASASPNVDNYYNDSYDIIYAWESSKKDKTAFLQFRQSEIQIKKKYKDLANF